MLDRIAERIADFLVDHGRFFFVVLIALLAWGLVTVVDLCLRLFGFR